MQNFGPLVKKFWIIKHLTWEKQSNQSSAMSCYYLHQFYRALPIFNILSRASDEILE